MRRPGIVSGGSFAATGGESPPDTEKHPPDIHRARHWCDRPDRRKTERIGTRIDVHRAMNDDLKSQIAISKPPFRAEEISRRIHIIRGHRVMLDADLAALYGVTTRRLNEQVKRNAKRFPEDFAFRLTAEEKTELVANCDRFERLKHSAAFPIAFTEH